MKNELIYTKHEGNRALRAGNWKIVAAGKASPWELYDLNADRSESDNLAAEMPNLVREMENNWEKQTQEIEALARKDAPVDSGDNRPKK